jgi:hypothetical protein
MPIGGSARNGLIALGFVAGVGLLWWGPVGAGDDRPDEVTLTTPTPSTGTSVWVEISHLDGGSDHPSSVADAPAPGPEAVRAYLAGVAGFGDPDSLLREGRTLCQLWRATEARGGGAVIVTGPPDTLRADRATVAEAAARDLCPETRHPVP